MRLLDSEVFKASILTGLLVGFGTMYIMENRNTEHENPTFEIERNHLTDSIKLEAQIETRFWKDEFNRINKELYRLEQQTKEIDDRDVQIFDSLDASDASETVSNLSRIQFEPD